MPLPTSHDTPLVPGHDRRTFIKASALSGFALAALAAAPGGAIARLLVAPEPVAIKTILTWTNLAPAGQTGPAPKFAFYALVDAASGGNSLLVVSQQKALLVDTKYPSYAGALKLDAASYIGADTSGDTINLTLINTHHHGDHTGGNPIIVPAAAASYAHKNALPRIKAQFSDYVQNAKAGADRLKQEDTPEHNLPDELIRLARQAADAAPTWTETTALPKIAIDASGSNLTIGEVKISTHHFGPGHTDNDLVVFFPDHNIIHTGDLVFNGLHPYFDPAGGANAKGWINALAQTRKLCNDTTVLVPGHGPVGDATAIDTQIAYLEALIAAVQGEIDKGTPKDEITAMSWDFMEGLGFEQAQARAISAVYDELKG